MGRVAARCGAVLTVLTAVALTGCAEGTGGGEPGPGVGVAELEEPQNFYEGEYLGRRVTVTALVTDVISPDSFEVGGAEYGEDSLLVMTVAADPPRVGEQVRVTGTVGQFHRLSEDDYAPGSYDRYEANETEPYLYGAVAEPA